MQGYTAPIKDLYFGITQLANLKEYSEMLKNQDIEPSNIKIIMELIKNGADVNALDNQGRSPVDFSFCCGGVDTDVSKLLRELGGNDGVDSEGK